MAFDDEGCVVKGARIGLSGTSRAAHERGLRHFLATGDGPILRRRVEVTAARRNGDEFPAELQVMPMRLGEEWVFSAFVRDITESKRAEEARAMIVAAIEREREVAASVVDRRHP